MSYATIEAAVKTLLEDGGVTGLSTANANVTQGNYRPLGKRNLVVVLQPGAIPEAGFAGNDTKRVKWVVEIEVFIKYNLDITSIASSIRSVRDGIITYLNKYPTLNGTAGVVLAEITNADKPEGAQSGSRTFWTQRLYLSATEETTITGGEYA